jgi:hypothetical protein
VPKKTPTLHLILRENRLKTQEISAPRVETSNPIKTASAKLHKLILTLAVYFNKIFAELQTTAD